MKQIVAPLMAAVLVVGAAGSAFADGDILQQLQDLSKQAQTQTQSTGSATNLTADTALLPDQNEVQMEIDLETGETTADRVASYTARLAAQVRTQPDDLASLDRLGIAYQLGGQQQQAQSALEQAILLEPADQGLYDTIAPSLAQVDPGLKVFVAGKPVAFDVSPTIVSGRTLVPIRAVAEQLGATVSWDPATSTATVSLNGTQVEVTKDSLTAKVNGTAVQLDVPATIMNGRTLLPLRFVSENLGQQVDYHPSGTAGSAVISIVNK